MKNCFRPHSKLADGLAPVLVTLCLACAVHAHPESVIRYDGQIEPHPGENFRFAQYCCWLPANVPSPKGVLCIVLHPHGNTGVRFENSVPWIELAGRSQCALLSLSFVEAADKTKPWGWAAEGSGRALLAALDEVAVASGVAELTKSRVVVAGICEAGQFAYAFSAYAPERVAAFMTMGGSRHQTSLAKQAAFVPGLLVAATDRGTSAFDDLASLFIEGQKLSAPWTFSLEQLADYDQGRCSMLVEHFLDSALTQLGKEPASSSTIVSRLLTEQLCGEEQPNFQLATNAGPCLGVGTTDWLRHWQADTSQFPKNSNSPSTPLSFVSVPLPALGHVGAEYIDAGRFPLAPGTNERATAIFQVDADEGSNVDGITVASGQDGFSWRAIQLSVKRWQIQCTLDLRLLPSGAFSVPVPIRFLSKNKVKPGGLNVVMAGRISRDVSSIPSAVNFGLVNESNQCVRLKIKSASGAPVGILRVESTLPGEARADIVAGADGAVWLDCSIHPSASLPRDFSGYYLLRVKSDVEQTLKILFFGEGHKQEK